MKHFTYSLIQINWQYNSTITEKVIHDDHFWLRVHYVPCTEKCIIHSLPFWIFISNELGSIAMIILQIRKQSQELKIKLMLWSIAQALELCTMKSVFCSDSLWNLWQSIKIKQRIIFKILPSYSHTVHKKSFLSQFKSFATKHFGSVLKSDNLQAIPWNSTLFYSFVIYFRKETYFLSAKKKKPNSWAYAGLF